MTDGEGTERKVEAPLPTGDTWVNFCWVCAAGVSEPLPHFSLFFGQLYTPYLTDLGRCHFRDPDVVTNSS